MIKYSSVSNLSRFWKNTTTEWSKIRILKNVGNQAALAPINVPLYGHKTTNTGSNDIKVNKWF